MPIRALIVLLVILNLGVALWWVTRTEPPPPSDPALPAGVELLRLPGEDAPATPAAPPVAAEAATGDAADAAAGDGAGAAGVAASSAPPAAAPPDPPAVAPERCLRLGPFDDAAAAGAAADAVRAAVLRQAVRTLPEATRGWDVRMAALPNRTAAEAMAGRLGAAGFHDHYLLSPDEDGRVDIALGRFSTEEGAQRHRRALQEAGFDAVAQPVGDAGVRHWLHVAVAQAADADALRRMAGAARASRVDCATLGAAAR